MTNPTYPLAPAKIGNASGFRLPASFYRDRPQFVNATGWVEVLNDNTLLVRLEPQPVEPESDSDDLMLSLFLDLVTKDALTNPEHLEAYTEEMKEKIALDPLATQFALTGSLRRYGRMWWQTLYSGNADSSQ